MLRFFARHASSASGLAKYYYQGATGELTMLDYVLAAAQGYPDQGHGILDWENMQRSLDAVRDPAFVEAYPVRFRPDMAKRLEDILRIDRALAPDMQTVTNLLRNRTSNGDLIPGKRYLSGTRRDGSEPQAFLETRISAGKTVSLAWAFADPGGRGDIRRAHQNAVETALRAVEGHAGYVRSGAAGLGPRETGDLAWITFFHTVNRLGEPGLHSHVAVLNLVASRTSDRVGSLHDRAMEEKHFGAIYQRALTENLKFIGLDAFYDPERNEAIVRGIPENVILAFSQRTEIAKQLAEQRIQAQTGQSLADLPKILARKAVMQALNDTRPPKEVGEGDWLAKLAEIGDPGWHPAQIYPESARSPLQNALEAPERRAFGLRLPDGGYHVGGGHDIDWGIDR